MDKHRLHDASTDIERCGDAELRKTIGRHTKRERENKSERGSEKERERERHGRRKGQHLHYELDAVRFHLYDDRCRWGARLSNLHKWDVRAPNRKQTQNNGKSRHFVEYLDIADRTVSYGNHNRNLPMLLRSLIGLNFTGQRFAE